MMEPKTRKARRPEEEIELPPAEVAEIERIIKEYAPVLRALANR